MPKSKRPKYPPPRGLEWFEFTNGWTAVHKKERCAGQFCCIHNPSLHPMIEEPMLLRATTLVERICRHGVGHPDPDSAAYFDRFYGHRPGTWSTHGCCAEQCCLGPRQWRGLDEDE